MQSLKTALNIFLRKSGLEKGVQQERAILLWAEAVGESIADQTEPEKVEHGTLFVKVSNPTWRQELQLQKNEIIEKVNNCIGRKAINNIKFV